MFPDLSQNDTTDIALRDSEVCSKGNLRYLSGRVGTTYLPDDVISQTRAVVALTTTDQLGAHFVRAHGSSNEPLRVCPRSVLIASSSPDSHDGAVGFTAGLSELNLHIRDIVSLGAGEEMPESWPRNSVDDVGANLIVSDTGRVIANVERPFSSGKHTARHQEGGCVGIGDSAILTDLAVSTFATCPGPLPARTEFGPVDWDCSDLTDLGPEAGDELGGILNLHRDLPLTWNRGARPGPVDAGYGASSRLNFTMSNRTAAY